MAVIVSNAGPDSAMAACSAPPMSVPLPLVMSAEPAKWTAAAIAASGGAASSMRTLHREVLCTQSALLGIPARPGLIAVPGALPQWLSADARGSVLDTAAARERFQHYAEVIPDGACVFVVYTRRCLAQLLMLFVDFSDDITTMAPELVAGDGDAHPAAAAAGGHLLDADGLHELDAAHGNPLMLFLQSLLPWNVVTPGHAEPGGPEAHGEAGFDIGDYEFDDDE